MVVRAVATSAVTGRDVAPIIVAACCCARYTPIPPLKKLLKKEKKNRNDKKYEMRRGKIKIKKVRWRKVCNVR